MDNYVVMNNNGDKSSIVKVAACRIQNWLKRVHYVGKYRHSVRNILPDCQIILDRYHQLDSISSTDLDISPFECLQLAQISILDKPFLMSFSRWLRSFPNKSFSKHCRVLSTALMIVKFPNQVLLGNEFESKELSILSTSEIRNCFYSAKSLSKSISTLIEASLSTSNRHKSLTTLVYEFINRAQIYLHSFEAWEHYDSQRVAASVEESFRDSYAILYSVSQMEEVNSSMLQAAEEQVNKIMTAMEQLLGVEKAQHRIEELRAGVQAAAALTLSLSSPQISPVSSSSFDVQETTNTFRNVDNTISNTILPLLISYCNIPPTPTHFTLNTNTIEDRIGQVMTYVDSITAFMAGGGAFSENASERLLHEVVLDKLFRLHPPPPNAAEAVQQQLQQQRTAYPLTDCLPANAIPPSQSVFDALAVVNNLKGKMLRLIGDKLYNSLTSSSSIADASQVTVGAIVSIFCPSNASNGGSGDDYDGAAQELQALTARVTAVNQGDASGSASGSLDIQYLADSSFELGVPLHRLKTTSSPGPSATLLLSSLSALGLSIADFTPNRPDIRKGLTEELLDRELMLQMVAHNALDAIKDLLPVLLRLMNSLESLQSAHRAEATKLVIAAFTDRFIQTCNTTNNTNTTNSQYAAMLPEFFEICHEFIDEIQRDMANYYITLIGPLLQQQGLGLQLLRSMFSRRILTTAAHSGGQVLGRTVGWLQRVGVTSAEGWQRLQDDLIEAGFSAELIATVPTSNNALNNPEVCRAITACAFLQLLQSTVRLDSIQGAAILPETLSFDGERLSKIRDVIDKICLECSIVITSRQLLGKYGIHSREVDETEMQHRLDVLLSEKDARFSSISTEVVHFLRFSIERHNSSSASAAFAVSYEPQELQERVDRSVREVVSANNPVLALFTKRIYKVLLRALLKQPFLQKLQAYSLNFKGQERNLSSLIRSTSLLFNHMYSIHSELYQSILVALQNMERSS